MQMPSYVKLDRMRVIAGARLRVGTWLMRLGLRVAGDELAGAVEEAEVEALDPSPLPPVEIGERGQELIASGVRVPAPVREVPEAPLEGSLAARFPGARIGGR